MPPKQLFGFADSGDSIGRTTTQIYFLDSAYFGVPVAKLCGIRRVVRVRNNLGYWLTRKHQALNRLLRPWVDVTLTNSDAGRDLHCWQRSCTPDQIAVIENGVDLSAIRPSEKLMDGPPVVGCVANLRPVKNVAGLLRAAKIVLERFPNVRFEVAGDGEQRSELEALKQSLGLGSRFLFRGAVSRTCRRLLRKLLDRRSSFPFGRNVQRLARVHGSRIGSRRDRCRGQPEGIGRLRNHRSAGERCRPGGSDVRSFVRSR